MISKILDKYNKWRNRCRSCEVDGIDKSLIGHYKNINAISKIKTVIEYKCDKCETLWVLADNAQFISKVVRNELYVKWKSQSWMPTISQMEILNQISLRGRCDFYDLLLNISSYLVVPAWMLQASYIMSWPVEQWSDLYVPTI